MSHLDEGTLHALLDGELETTEVAEIQAHLGSCSACGLRLREAKEFLGEADRMIASVDMGPGVRPPVMASASRAEAQAPRIDAGAEPPERPRARPRPPAADQQPGVPPELRSEQAVILIPDNEAPAERRLKRIRRVGWAAMIAVIAGSVSVWVGKFGAPAGSGGPDTAASPAAVVSPREMVPAERPILARDSTLAPAPKPAPRRQAAPAESTVTRKKPTPAAPAVPERKLAAKAPVPQDSAAPADSTGTRDSSATAASEAPATDSAAPADLADVRARAAEALAQLDREKRRNEAAAATAALDSEKRRRAGAATQPAGAAAARTEAAPTPPAPPTLEQRARVYLRIGLDEASRQLGGPAHVIEGMSPIFMGLAQGGVVPGADGSRPVVRVVYQDAQGRLIMLDQQRVRSGQPVPKPSPLTWTQGDILMWLDGEVNPEVLRTLRPRVR